MLEENTIDEQPFNASEHSWKVGGYGIVINVWKTGMLKDGWHQLSF